MASYAQCFLLVAHKKKILDSLVSESRPPRTRSRSNVGSQSSRSPCAKKTPKRTTMSIYALIPYVQRHDHHFCHTFAQNGITVLTDTELDPSLINAVTSNRVELIEMFFRAKKSEGPEDLFHVHTKDFNKDILAAIMTGCTIDADESNFKALSDSENTDFVLDDEENMDIIKELVSHGTEIKYRHKHGGTILHFAIKKANEPLVRFLVKKGAEVDARTKHGQTPLHLAATMYRYEKNISIPIFLVEHGADIHATVLGLEKYEGVTPLHLALNFMNVKLAKYLLEKGASVDAETACRGNVLECAIGSFYPVLVTCVLLHNPDLKKTKNQEAYLEAVRILGRHDDIVKMLETYGFKLEPKDIWDPELLFSAFENDDLDLIKDFLKWGAEEFYRSKPVDKIEDLVEELIFKAVKFKFTGAFEFLLELDNSCNSGTSFIAKRFSSNEFNKNDREAWCKVILQSGDLQLAPILAILPDESSWKSITNYLAVLKAANLRVNETFFKNLEKIDASTVAECWLEALKAPPSSFIADQVRVLKSEMIGDSNISFHDLLNMPLCRSVRLMKNKNVVYVLKRIDLDYKFYSYFPLIHWRFRKAYYRRTLLDKAMKMFNFLFKDSSKLPFEIKEHILDYLRNLDLLVLMNVCEIPDSDS